MRKANHVGLEPRQVLSEPTTSFRSRTENHDGSSGGGTPENTGDVAHTPTAASSRNLQDPRRSPTRAMVATPELELFPSDVNSWMDGDDKELQNVVVDDEESSFGNKPTWLAKVPLAMTAPKDLEDAKPAAAEMPSQPAWGQKFFPFSPSQTNDYEFRMEAVLLEKETPATEQPEDAKPAAVDNPNVAQATGNSAASNQKGPLTPKKPRLVWAKGYSTVNYKTDYIGGQGSGNYNNEANVRFRDWVAELYQQWCEEADTRSRQKLFKIVMDNMERNQMRMVKVTNKETGECKVLVKGVQEKVATSFRQYNRPKNTKRSLKTKK